MGEANEEVNWGMGIEDRWGCAAGEVKWCQSDVVGVRVLCSRGGVKCGVSTKGKHERDLDRDEKGIRNSG